MRGTGADVLRVDAMSRCMMPVRERHMGDVTCVAAGKTVCVCVCVCVCV